MWQTLFVCKGRKETALPKTGIACRLSGIDRKSVHNMGWTETPPLFKTSKKHAGGNEPELSSHSGWRWKKKEQLIGTSSKQPHLRRSRNASLENYDAIIFTSSELVCLRSVCKRLFVFTGCLGCSICDSVISLALKMYGKHLVPTQPTFFIIACLTRLVIINPKHSRPALRANESVLKALWTQLCSPGKMLFSCAEVDEGCAHFYEIQCGSRAQVLLYNSQAEWTAEIVHTIETLSYKALISPLP